MLTSDKNRQRNQTKNNADNSPITVFFLICRFFNNRHVICDYLAINSLEAAYHHSLHRSSLPTLNGNLPICRKEYFVPISATVLLKLTH